MLAAPDAWDDVERISGRIAHIVGPGDPTARIGRLDEGSAFARLEPYGPSRLLRALAGPERRRIVVRSPRARAIVEIDAGTIVHASLRTATESWEGAEALAGLLSLGSGRVHAQIDPGEAASVAPNMVSPLQQALGNAIATRPPLLSTRPPPAAAAPRLPSIAPVLVTAKPSWLPGTRVPSVPPLQLGALGELELGEVLDTGARIVIQAAVRIEQGAREAVTVERLADGVDAHDILRARFDTQRRLVAEHEIAGLLLPHFGDRERCVWAAPVESVGTVEHLPALEWTIERRVAFVQQVAEIIAALHEADVVHGALRPSNLVLDADLRPWVAGALLVAPGDPTAEGVNGDAYAAPEPRIEVASDVFALGRVLHYVLLGDVPDRASEPTPRLDEILETPAGLVRIVRRATHADPRMRYPTVQALVDDLNRYGDHAMVGIAHPDVREPNLGLRTTSLFPRPHRIERVRAPLRKKPTKPSDIVPLRELPTDLPAPLRKGLASVGIITALAALGLAAAFGAASFQGWIALVGAVLVTLAIPVSGRVPWLSRIVFATLAGALVFVVAPTELVSAATASWRLGRDSPEARSRAVQAMIASGDPALDGADLRSTSLRRVDLAYASLVRADLGDADLRDSYLTSADLRGARLVGARLEGADLSAANLRGATLDGARCDPATSLPTEYYCNNGQIVRDEAQ